MLENEANQFAYVYASTSNSDLFIKALDYIKSNLHSDVSKLFKDDSGLRAFYFVAKMIAFEIAAVDFQQIELKSFDAFISDLMFYFYENRHKLDFTNQGDLFNAEKAESKEEIELICFRFC